MSVKLGKSSYNYYLRLSGIDNKIYENYISLTDNEQFSNSSGATN